MLCITNMGMIKAFIRALLSSLAGSEKAPSNDVKARKSANRRRVGSGDRGRDRIEALALDDIRRFL